MHLLCLLLFYVASAGSLIASKQANQQRRNLSIIFIKKYNVLLLLTCFISLATTWGSFLLLYILFYAILQISE